MDDSDEETTAAEDESEDDEDDESRLFSVLLLGMLERRLIDGFTFTLRPMSFWLGLISRVLQWTTRTTYGLANVLCVHRCRRVVVTQVRRFHHTPTTVITHQTRFMRTQNAFDSIIGIRAARL